MESASKRVGKARSTVLTFGHGCNGKTLYKYGQTYACGGPIHEDPGLMQHENHCMLVAEHDWSFVGVQGEKGVLQDPGTNYCLDALNSPWNGMLGLQICNSTDKSMLWVETTHVNGVFGFMTEGNHVKEYYNVFNGMLLNRHCRGKCYNARVCLPTADYSRRVNNTDFLPTMWPKVPDDPIAPIR